jgi:hypothetical protein
MKQELAWPEGIVAHRHEISGNWVLWYLTDAQAGACAVAMGAPDARVQLLAKALREAKYWLTDGAVPSKDYGLLPDSLSAIEAIDEALKEVGMEG